MRKLQTLLFWGLGLLNKIKNLPVGADAYKNPDFLCFL